MNEQENIDYSEMNTIEALSEPPGKHKNTGLGRLSLLQLSYQGSPDTAENQL